MYLWAFFKPQPLLQTHWMEHYLDHSTKRWYRTTLKSGMFLCSRDDKHIPLTVLLAPRDEALLGHGLQVLLDGGSVDSDCLGKGRDGYSGFCHQ